jgi:PIN domain nuclease of toxin-antitoxin system
MTPTHVLDTSAVIAYLNKETGWDVTATILAKPANSCQMHAVNWCEVWHISRQTCSEADADQIVADLRSIGIGEESDSSFWREAGVCRHSVRSAGKSIALMDCFAVALAKQRGVPVVTADHGEFDYVKTNGICSVIFIRDSKTQPLSAVDFAAATS